MNTESSQIDKKTLTSADDFSMDDFDFKPITSGLGFHHQQIKDVKPVFTDKPVNVSNINSKLGNPPLKPESQVYQSDLSLFYQAQNESQATEKIVPKIAESEEITEEIFHSATASQRVIAYGIDLTLLSASLSIVMLVMARVMELDIVEAWRLFPHEMTPLCLILFCGFYLIYFSIFEKGKSSTLGKNILGIRVVNNNHQTQTLGLLVLRTFISLLNFISLGLFSWFDLQNKVTNSKVIRVK